MHRIFFFNRKVETLYSRENVFLFFFFSGSVVFFLECPWRTGCHGKIRLYMLVTPTLQVKAEFTAILRMLQCTVFLHRGSCIYIEKSYGMSHGSYYKISMILRQVELEFSKINVFRGFQDPVTFGSFFLHFTSLLNKIQHIGVYFHFVENAEVLMLKISCISPECNYF